MYEIVEFAERVAINVGNNRRIIRAFSARNFRSAWKLVKRNRDELPRVVCPVVSQ